jgi:RNase adaptor protein for sRNA GlmZ degradation
MSKCLSDKETIDQLLEENLELHQLLKDARQQACIALGCYVHACAAYEEVPQEFIAASIANQDADIFKYKTVDKLPESYKATTEFLWNILDHYEADGKSIVDVSNVIKTWPTKNKILH